MSTSTHFSRPTWPGAFTRSLLIVCLLHLTSVAQPRSASAPPRPAHGPAAEAVRAERLAPQQKPVSRYATFQGIKIYYESFGVGRQALVLVHGWACDLTFWSEQTANFAGKMRVIQLDLPGHGRSGKPQDIEYTQNLFALSINAVLEDAGVDKAVLLGHSMGAYTSRQFYRRFPQKVLALGFIDAPMQSFTLPPTALDIFVKELESPLYKISASLFIDNMLIPNTTASMRRSVKDRMLQTPSNVMASAMHGLGDPAIYERDKIHVPLFAIYKELFLPKDNELFLLRLDCDLDYQVWKDVPHFLMLVKPTKFNEAFLAFLEEYKLLLGAKTAAVPRRPRQADRPRRARPLAPLPA